MGIESEALKAYPPTAITRTAAVTTSTNVAISTPGFYLFGVEASSGDGVYVLFGASNSLAVTSSTGMHLAAGEKIERFVPATVTHYAIIRKTGDEVFFHAKTGD